MDGSFSPPYSSGPPHYAQPHGTPFQYQGRVPMFFSTPPPMGPTGASSSIPSASMRHSYVPPMVHGSTRPAYTQHDVYSRVPYQPPQRAPSYDVSRDGRTFDYASPPPPPHARMPSAPPHHPAARELFAPDRTIEDEMIAAQQRLTQPQPGGMRVPRVPSAPTVSSGGSGGGGPSITSTGMPQVATAVATPIPAPTPGPASVTPSTIPPPSSPFIRPPTSSAPIGIGGGAGVGMLKREGSVDAMRGGRRGLPSRGKDELGPAMEFGLLGLMDVLQMKSQDMNLVRVGYDLTSLGLNPNSQELLFPSFVSPWPTSRRPPPEFQIPECYQLKEPPNLKPSMFSKFSLETLIYIFHSVPGDVIQMAAAQELYLRKWRFHKGLKQWISRAPKGTSALDSQRSEVGTYSVFDVSKWEKIRREGFKLLYEDLVELRAETKA